MFIGPEKLTEIFGRGSKTGLAINSPVNRCVGCPFAGMCTPCKPTAVTSEVSVFKPGNLTTLGKLATLKTVEIKVGATASLSFRPVGETVRPVPSEKTCSQCGKNPNTCLHSERHLRRAA